MGIAWSKEARLNFCINEFKIQDCQIPLSFTFENLEEIFGRDPGKPPVGAAKKKQLYTTFALMHENESRFQILNVPTAFDHLDYNFFADQFSKVRMYYIIYSHFIFNRLSNFFRILIMRPDLLQLLKRLIEIRGSINTMNLMWEHLILTREL